VVAGTAFVILLPAIAPVHQSASWVFTTFAPDKAYSGIESNGLLFMLSLLGSQWAMGKAVINSCCCLQHCISSEQGLASLSLYGTIEPASA
jgi:hypothetical protein